MTSCDIRAHGLITYDYDWEKYLRLDEGFISSALASLEALQQTWE